MTVPIKTYIGPSPEELLPENWSAYTADKPEIAEKYPSPPSSYSEFISAMGGETGIQIQENQAWDGRAGGSGLFIDRGEVQGDQLTAEDQEAWDAVPLKFKRLFEKLPEDVPISDSAKLHYFQAYELNKDPFPIKKIAQQIRAFEGRLTAMHDWLGEEMPDKAELYCFMVGTLVSASKKDDLIHTNCMNYYYDILIWEYIMEKNIAEIDGFSSEIMFRETLQGMSEDDTQTRLEELSDLVNQNMSTLFHETQDSSGGVEGVFDRSIPIIESNRARIEELQEEIDSAQVNIDARQRKLYFYQYRILRNKIYILSHQGSSESLRLVQGEYNQYMAKLSMLPQDKLIHAGDKHSKGHEADYTRHIEEGKQTVLTELRVEQEIITQEWLARKAEVDAKPPTGSYDNQLSSLEHERDKATLHEELLTNPEQALDHAIFEYSQNAVIVDVIEDFNVIEAEFLENDGSFIVESYYEFIHPNDPLPDLVIEQEDGRTPVLAQGNGSKEEDWVFVTRLDDGSVKIDPYPIKNEPSEFGFDFGDSTADVLDLNRARSLPVPHSRTITMERFAQMQVEQQTYEYYIQASLQNNTALQSLVGLGQGLMSEVGQLQTLMQQGMTAYTKQDLFLDALKEKAGHVRDFWLANADGIISGIDHAYSVINSFKDLRVGAHLSEMESMLVQLETMLTQVNQLFVENDPVMELCDEIDDLDDSYTRDQVEQWIETQGVILITSIAVSIAIVSVVGAVIAIPAGIAGLAMTAGLMGLGMVIGEELALTGLSYTKYGDMGYKSMWQKATAGEITNDELWEGYLSKWGKQSLMCLAFMGAGRLIGAGSRLAAGSTNARVAGAGRSMLQAGGVIQRSLNQVIPGNSAVGRFWREFISEIFEESAEGVAQEIHPVFGAVVTTLNCMDGRNVEVAHIQMGVTKKGMDIIDGELVVDFEFEAGQQQELFADLKRRYELSEQHVQDLEDNGVTPQSRVRWAGNHIIEVTVPIQGSDKSMTYRFTATQEPYFLRSVVSKKIRESDDGLRSHDEYLREDIGITPEEAHNVANRGCEYRVMPGVGVELITDTFKKFGIAHFGGDQNCADPYLLFETGNGVITVYTTPHEATLTPQTEQTQEQVAQEESSRSRKVIPELVLNPDNQDAFLGSFDEFVAAFTGADHILEIRLAIPDVTQMDAKAFEKALREHCADSEVGTVRIHVTDQATGFDLVYDLQVNSEWGRVPTHEQTPLTETQMSTVLQEVFSDDFNAVMQELGNWSEMAQLRFFYAVNDLYLFKTTPTMKRPSLIRIHIPGTPRKSSSDGDVQGYEIKGPQEYTNDIKALFEKAQQREANRSHPYIEIPEGRRPNFPQVQVGRDGVLGTDSFRLRDCFGADRGSFLIQQQNREHPGGRCPFIGMVNAFQAQVGGLTELELVNAFRHVMEEVGEPFKPGYNLTEIANLNREFGGNPETINNLSQEDMPKVYQALQEGQIVLLFNGGGTRVLTLDEKGTIVWFSFMSYPDYHHFNEQGQAWDSRYDRPRRPSGFGQPMSLTGNPVMILDPASVSRMLGVEHVLAQNTSGLTPSQTQAEINADREETRNLLNDPDVARRLRRAENNEFEIWFNPNTGEYRFVGSNEGQTHMGGFKPVVTDEEGNVVTDFEETNEASEPFNVDEGWVCVAHAHSKTPGESVNPSVDDLVRFIQSGASEHIILQQDPDSGALKWSRIYRTGNTVMIDFSYDGRAALQGLQLFSQNLQVAVAKLDADPQMPLRAFSGNNDQDLILSGFDEVDNLYAEIDANLSGVIKTNEKLLTYNEFIECLEKISQSQALTTDEKLEIFRAIMSNHDPESVNRSTVVTVNQELRKQMKRLEGAEEIYQASLDQDDQAGDIMLPPHIVRNDPVSSETATLAQDVVDQYENLEGECIAFLEANKGVWDSEEFAKGVEQIREATVWSDARRHEALTIILGGTYSTESTQLHNMYKNLRTQLTALEADEQLAQTIVIPDVSPSQTVQEEQARVAAEEQARVAAEEQARVAAEEQARVAAEEAVNQEPLVTRDRVEALLEDLGELSGELELILALSQDHTEILPDQERALIKDALTFAVVMTSFLEDNTEETTLDNYERVQARLKGIKEISAQYYIRVIVGQDSLDETAQETLELESEDGARDYETPTPLRDPEIERRLEDVKDRLVYDLLETNEDMSEANNRVFSELEAVIDGLDIEGQRVLLDAISATKIKDLSAIMSVIQAEGVSETTKVFVLQCSNDLEGVLNKAGIESVLLAIDSLASDEQRTQVLEVLSNSHWRDAATVIPFADVLNLDGLSFERKVLAVKLSADLGRGAVPFAQEMNVSLNNIRSLLHTRLLRLLNDENLSMSMRRLILTHVEGDNNSLGNILTASNKKVHFNGRKVKLLEAIDSSVFTERHKKHFLHTLSKGNKTDALKNVMSEMNYFSRFAKNGHVPDRIIDEYKVNTENRLTYLTAYGPAVFDPSGLSTSEKRTLFLLEYSFGNTKKRSLMEQFLTNQSARSYSADYMRGHVVLAIKFADFYLQAMNKTATPAEIRRDSFLQPRFDPRAVGLDPNEAGQPFPAPDYVPAMHHGSLVVAHGNGDFIAEFYEFMEQIKAVAVDNYENFRPFLEDLDPEMKRIFDNARPRINPDGVYEINVDGKKGECIFEVKKAMIGHLRASSRDRISATRHEGLEIPGGTTFDQFFKYARLMLSDQKWYMEYRFVTDADTSASDVDSMRAHFEQALRTDGFTPTQTKSIMERLTIKLVPTPKFRGR